MRPCTLARGQRFLSFRINESRKLWETFASSPISTKRPLARALVASLKYFDKVSSPALMKSVLVFLVGSAGAVTVPVIKLLCLSITMKFMDARSRKHSSLC